MATYIWKDDPKQLYIKRAKHSDLALGDLRREISCFSRKKC